MRPDRRQDGDGKFTLWVDGKQVAAMTESEEDDHILIVLEGELRKDYIWEFSDEFQALVSVGMNLVLDMNGVSYVSNAGMDDLLSLQIKLDQLKKGSLRLRRLQDNVRDSFDAVGLSYQLDIE